MTLCCSCASRREGAGLVMAMRERENHEKPWLRLACIVHRSRIFFQFSWKNVIARVKQEKYGKPHTYVLGRYAIGIRRIPNCWNKRENFVSARQADVEQCINLIYLQIPGLTGEKIANSLPLLTHTHTRNHPISMPLTEWIKIDSVLFMGS